MYHQKRHVSPQCKNCRPDQVINTLTIFPTFSRVLEVSCQRQHRSATLVSQTIAKGKRICILILSLRAINVLQASKPHQRTKEKKNHRKSY